MKLLDESHRRPTPLYLQIIKKFQYPPRTLEF